MSNVYSGAVNQASVSQTGGSQTVGVVGDSAGLAAILSPLRRRMLENLDQPDSASGLARRLGIPRQKINYHLRKLEDAGLVELVEEKMRRGCLERLVRVTARAFVVSPEFLEGLSADPETIADRYSSAYLVAAAARMVRQVAEQREKAEKAGQLMATFTLESEVAFQSPADFNAFTRELAEAVARLSSKYDRRQSGSSRPFRIVVGAHPRPAAPVQADNTTTG
ncbi:MAG TPA: helix-turn-helix domain-containing protein [Blastocatellia bacterium]|nr:helix-turn-helix domain-containing protein [Blastocatellia bacterium]